VALTAAGVAVASMPSTSAGAVTGCVSKSSGAMRVIDYQAGKRCQAGEYTVSLSKGLRYRGSWHAKARYSVSDIVYFKGSSYVAKKQSRNKPPATHHGYWGLLAHKGGTGPAGPTASAYAQNQNGFVYVNSTTTPTVAVQLSANGGRALKVGFRARLQVSGVVRLRNNTGNGNTDQSGCTPQVSRNGGAFTDVGPQMLGLTNGFNAFNDEATIAVLGETNVSPGTYDARIVCVRTYFTGSTDQNKFNGDAISVIAVRR
jgi:hypothetical protein